MIFYINYFLIAIFKINSSTATIVDSEVKYIKYSFFFFFFFNFNTFL